MSCVSDVYCSWVYNVLCLKKFIIKRYYYYSFPKHCNEIPRSYCRHRIDPECSESIATNIAYTHTHTHTHVDTYLKSLIKSRFYWSWFSIINFLLGPIFLISICLFLISNQTTNTIKTGLEASWLPFPLPSSRATTLISRTLKEYIPAFIKGALSW